MEKPYAGHVTGPVYIRLSDEVVLEVAELKVINHLESLGLIRADILCGGHKGWSFWSMGVSAAGGGLINFTKGCHMSAIPLVNAPMLDHPKFVSRTAHSGQTALGAMAPTTTTRGATERVEDTLQEQL